MADLNVGIRIRAEDRSSAALEKVARRLKKLGDRLAASRKDLLDLSGRDSAARKLESLQRGLSRTVAKMASPTSVAKPSRTSTTASSGNYARYSQVDRIYARSRFVSLCESNRAPDQRGHI